MSFHDEWGAVFNKSINAFTGRNKVQTQRGGTELEDVVKGTNALMGSLKTLDGLNPAIVPEPKAKAATLKLFSKEMTGPFAGAAKKYNGVLDAAIKVTDKIVHPQAYRELKVLKTQLALMVAKVDSVYTTNAKDNLKALAKADEALKKETEAARGKGMSDDQVKDHVYLLKAKKLLLQYVPVANSAFAKAAAAVQKIKADPTPATYNRVMDDGGRDLSTQINNLYKITSDKNAADWALVKALPDLKPYSVKLSQFGSGEKRTVDNFVDADNILLLLKEFSALIKSLVPIHATAVTEIKKMK